MKKEKEQYCSNLFDEYFKLHEESAQEALIDLYKKLIKLIATPIVCDELIEYIYKNKIDLSSDAIVHIANSLGFIKKELKNWNSFCDFCSDELKYKIGEDRAVVLIKLFLKKQ